MKVVPSNEMGDRRSELLREMNKSILLLSGGGKGNNFHVSLDSLMILTVTHHFNPKDLAQNT